MRCIILLWRHISRWQFVWGHPGRADEIIFLQQPNRTAVILLCPVRLTKLQTALPISRFRTVVGPHPRNGKPTSLSATGKQMVPLFYIKFCNNKLHFQLHLDKLSFLYVYIKSSKHSFTLSRHIIQNSNNNINSLSPSREYNAQILSIIFSTRARIFSFKQTLV